MLCKISVKKYEAFKLIGSKKNLQENGVWIVLQLETWSSDYADTLIFMFRTN